MTMASKLAVVVVRESEQQKMIQRTRSLHDSGEPLQQLEVGCSCDSLCPSTSPGTVSFCSVPTPCV